MCDFKIGDNYYLDHAKRVREEMCFITTNNANGETIKVLTYVDKQIKLYLDFEGDIFKIERSGSNN